MKLERTWLSRALSSSFSSVMARYATCTRHHVLACNFAKHSPILNIFFADRLSNKPFLIWLLTPPPHLKYVATLPSVPCNLSLITCFLTLMFHKVMWQHMQEVVGFLVIS